LEGEENELITSAQLDHGNGSQSMYRWDKERQIVWQKCVIYRNRHKNIYYM